MSVYLLQKSVVRGNVSEVGEGIGARSRAVDVRKGIVRWELMGEARTHCSLGIYDRPLCT